MQEKLRALKAAFPHTIPVLTGYSVLGFVFGMLLSAGGYGAGWAALMSILVFAGSMQYVAVGLLAAPFGPVGAFLATLAVNARHLFYGVAMIEPFRDMGAVKPYLIFGLTDETFSIEAAARPPDGTPKKWFFFFITLLDHLYWIGGSVLGALFAGRVRVDLKGLDFAMTALFAVIFTEQWRGGGGRAAALTGAGASLACLLMFGPGNFLIPAMLAMTALLLLLRPILEGRGEE